ncbi:MAG TPA: PAS domain-containing protein, partial [Gammaproteobacteria bacterium]|nr:PAS domain-containing protein [Gammaproteobacteria bacterium]
MIHQRNPHGRLGPGFLLWLGILLCVLFYLVDVLLDVYVFRQGELLDQLLRPSGHELWMRLAIVGLCMSFALYSYCHLRREIKSAERALTAERFLSSVVENIPDMIFIKDARDLRFVRVNHATEQILGLSREELLGRSDYDLFPGMQADFFTGKDREVLETGKAVAIPEEEVESRHLGTRVLRTTKVPIFDDAGQSAYLLGIAEDITETWKAEQALQKTETRFRT